MTPRALVAALTAVALTLGSAPVAAAQGSVGPWGQFLDDKQVLFERTNPLDDHAFYQAQAQGDLDALAPGTILAERTIPYHVVTVPTPLQVTQIRYVTTNVTGGKESNVTSVIHPPGPSDGNVVVYGSFYDSLNPADNPSRLIAGNMSLGGVVYSTENPIIAPALLSGHPVIVTDIQGTDANFAAGPGYGMATLDAVRAAAASPAAPVTPNDRLGLVGYSGGAIASNWSAILLDSYAPELSDNVVGVSQGGMLVNPINNLGYAGNGRMWSGIVAMALVGLARAYDVDVRQYLSERGLAIYHEVQNLSIVEAMGRFPHLHWSDVARPEYGSPQEAPELWRITQKVNMGIAPIPDQPMFVVQGAGGELELTPAQHPGVGPGDGIMVTGDTRSLLRRYCEADTRVEYREYAPLSHVLAGAVWAVEGHLWMEDRFAGIPAPENCATVPPGTPIG